MGQHKHSIYAIRQPDKRKYKEPVLRGLTFLPIGRTKVSPHMNFLSMKGDAGRHDVTIDANISSASVFCDISIHTKYCVMHIGAL